MSDLNHFNERDHFVDSPAVARTERLVDGAMRNIAAGRSAHGVLRDIDLGVGRPDELAEQLLALLVGADDAHRADIVKGFLRPIEKRIEGAAAKVQGAK